MENTLNITRKEAERQIEALKLVWGIIKKVLDKEKDYLASQYYQINFEEEKKHVSGKPSSVKNFLTVNEGAIYFSVKWIIEPLKQGNIYNLSDLIKCRHSCLYGESIVLNFGNQLKDVDLEKVLAFDYCALQNVEGVI